MARLASIKATELEVAPKRKTFDAQKLILQSDPNQMFTRISDAILSKYRPIELERTGMVFPLERGRVGRQLQAEAGRVKSSFEGGFGPMQETLLQVETLMPQSVLEELKITRKADLMPNKPMHLVFEMSHICWKATEGTP